MKIPALDPEGVTSADLAALQARGVKTVCHVPVGIAESHRDDHDRFPADALGLPLADWEEERHVDIRRLDAAVPIMRRRVERRCALGLDAADPDDMDLFENETGRGIPFGDRRRCMERLIAVAHGPVLEIAQKNAPGLIAPCTGCSIS